MFGLFSNPINKGIELMREARNDEAERYFLSLIEKNKAPADSYFNLGRLYFKLDNIPKSKESLHKALTLKPTPQMIKDILEITNWKMISSYNFHNSHPDISHDGKLLAYVSARKDTNGDGKISNLDLCGVYVYDLIKNQEALVVSDKYYNSRPVFSPDGKALIYLSIRNEPTPEGKLPDNPGFYMLDLESGRETLLLDHSNKIKYYVFTPDGAGIIFSCWIPGGIKSGLYKLDLATKKITNLVSTDYENTFPQISPDGHNLVFSSWRSDTNGDGTIDFRDNSSIVLRNLVTLEESYLARDNYNNSFPLFSNCGEKVLYLSIRRDTNGDGKIDALDNPGIYLYDLKHKREHGIVEDSHLNKFPQFTFDDQRIVFTSNWRRPKKDGVSMDYFEYKGIYQYDLIKKHLKQVVSDKYYGSRTLVVSKSTYDIAYVSWRRNTNRGLYLAHLDYLPDPSHVHDLIDNNL